MDLQTVEYRSEGPVAFLSLNRPGKLNAIDEQMVSELNHALDRAEADEAVRVIILSGNGRAFSAGFDLGSDDEGSLDVDAVRKELTDDFNIIMRFWDSPKVTIAAVHGHCLGSAMEMAVACDITVSSDDCLFGAPEVQFGSGIVALILPWVIGPKRSKELLLTGDHKISASQAVEMGLINRVVPGSSLLDEATLLATRIAVNDSLAVRLTKQAINRGYEIAGMRQAMLEALELDVVVESSETEESRQFNEILRSQGTKAAIAWRNARFEVQKKERGESGAG